MINTILANHTVGVSTDYCSYAGLENTLWNGNIEAWRGNIFHTNDYTGDPAFAADGYHLMANSAAIDRGVDSEVTADIDGQPRRAGFAPDLGADERPDAALFLQQTGEQPLNLGQTFTYTIILTNVGNSPATNVVLTDLLPSEHQVLGATTPRGTCAFGTGWGDKLVCAVGTLAPGQRADIILTGHATTTPPAKLPWLIRNTLQVTAVEAGNTMTVETILQNCHARLNNDPIEYDTVQAAVDASVQADDVIRVAGACGGVNTYGGLRQHVYLSKTLTLRGGYTNAFTEPPDAEANPTTLDALGQGRVLYVVGSISPTIEGMRLTGGNGGGVYVIAATVTLRHNWLFENSAASGGGLFVSDAQVTLDRNTIFSNTALLGGGLYSGNSQAVLSGNLITANAASSGGGGLLFGSIVTLTGNTVAGNGAARGGGLYGYSSTITLRNNTVISNTAGFAGGLYLEGNVATLDQNTISNSNGVGVALFYGTATLHGNTISNNNDHGVKLYGGTATLDENTISNNNGSGVSLIQGTAALNRNVIVSNITYWVYGGLSLEFSSATLTNNLIADNHGGRASGGLLVSGSSLQSLHTTLARNAGSSGIYIVKEFGVPSTVTLTNTVLVSHTVGISVTEGNTVTLQNTLWDGNLQNWGGAGAISHTNDYVGDPAFALDGYHLISGSAAMDRGIHAGVTDDIDGEPRPSGAGYDLGADEYYPHPALAVSKAAALDPVLARKQLTYTVQVVNTGNVDLHATITDTLPIHIVPGETSGGSLILPGGTLTWAADIAPLGTWSDTFVVTGEVGYAGPLTNVVASTTREGASGSYTLTTWIPYLYYLPLVMKP